MSEERYDLFRLYLANMEQYRVIKKVFNFALILLGAIAAVYALIFQKNYSALWVVFFTLLILYFIVGDFFVGSLVFGPPDRIIGWAAKQKMKEPDMTNAGELATVAAKFLRNGSVTLCRETLDQVFKLKNVSSGRLMFANTVLADLYRTEGDFDKSIKTLKNHVLRKNKNFGSYSLFVFGRALLQQGEYERAIEAFEDARDHLKGGNIGIPDLQKSKSKNKTMRNYYGETLQVFVPFYLGKACFWGQDEERRQEAAENLNSAIVLCRNRHLRPLLKQDFGEKE